MARPRSNIAPRIVKAARTRFLKEGVDGASLRDIARDAKTNIGMVVYYFPTKDDLFVAAIEDIYAALLADVTKIFSAETSTRERFQNVFQRFGEASDSELQVIRLMLREALGSSPRFSRLMSRFMRGHAPLVMKVVTEGISSGEFDKKIPPPLIALAAFGVGMVPQLARHVVPFPLPKAEKLAAMSAAILFRSVSLKKRTNAK